MKLTPALASKMVATSRPELPGGASRHPPEKLVRSHSAGHHRGRSGHTKGAAFGAPSRRDDRAHRRRVVDGAKNTTNRETSRAPGCRVSLSRLQRPNARGPCRRGNRRTGAPFVHERHGRESHLPPLARHRLSRSRAAARSLLWTTLRLRQRRGLIASAKTEFARVSIGQGRFFQRGLDGRARHQASICTRSI
jgi:hypothetical protein